MKSIATMIVIKSARLRLFLTMSLGLLLMVPLYAQTGSISIQLNNVTVKQALKQLEAKTTYTFLYQDALLKGSKPVQVKATNQPLATVLKQILQPSGLTYDVDDNVIVLKRLPPAPQVATERVLTGRILDNENLTLPGATIKLKDRQEAGVVSDNDGHYSITLPTSEVVVMPVGHINGVLQSDDFSLLIQEAQNGFGVIDRLEQLGIGLD